MARVAAPNTMRRRFQWPPISDIHSTPAISDISTIAGIAIVGSPSHELSWIAPYCFSSTATQKIGREKKRNAMSVTA